MTKNTSTMSFSIDNKYAARLKKLTPGTRSIVVNNALKAHMNCEESNYCITSNTSSELSQSYNLSNDEIKSLKQLLNDKQLLKDIKNFVTETDEND